MEWNYNYGNFSYFYDARTGKRKDSNTGSYGTYSAGTVPSDGTGLTLVDPEAWYYWPTEKQKYWNHVTQYVTGGLNGGARPYGNFTTWSGQFEGWYYLFVKNTPRPDTTPPPAITDLKAVTNGSDILLTWTAPSAPDLARYHSVWCTKPISETSTPNTSVTNWWAANTICPNLIPNPGTQRSLVISPSSTTPFYAAIFTFDQADNRSAMSNVAQATSSPIPTPAPTATPTPTPKVKSKPRPKSIPTPIPTATPTLVPIVTQALIPVSNPVNPSVPDSSSFLTTQSWGIAGDIPIPADYDGDNKADITVWRPFDGNWYLLLSSTTSPFIQPWGVFGDRPVTGDYDGDL